MKTFPIGADRLPDGFVECKPGEVLACRFDLAPYLGVNSVWYCDLFSDLTVTDVVKNKRTVTCTIHAPSERGDYYVVCRLAVGGELLLPTGKLKVW